MKILIVDSTVERQAALARKIRAFDQADLELLDISLALANQDNYLERLFNVDVLIIGAGLEDLTRQIAHDAKEESPHVEIISCVAEEVCSSSAFRAAHVAKVRKVVPAAVSSFDLLQELVRIHEDFRHSGRTKTGVVVTVVQAKGGVGATSICAALGEVCDRSKRKVLLWDMDIETSDLCRGLTASGTAANVIASWIDGSRELSRESFRDALYPISENTSILGMPEQLAARMALLNCSSEDGMRLLQRMLDLARTQFDCIIVDTAGRLGLGTGVLVRDADSVVTVIDDSILGLSGTHQFIGTLKQLTRDVEQIKFLCSGTGLGVEEIRRTIEDELSFSEKAWSLAPIAYDKGVAHWAASGKTLYTMGQRSMRNAFEENARLLSLVPEHRDVVRFPAPRGGSKTQKVRDLLTAKGALKKFVVSSP